MAGGVPAMNGFAGAAGALLWSSGLAAAPSSRSGPLPVVLLLASPFFRHVNLVRDFCLVTGAVPASTVGSPCDPRRAAYTLASTKASTAVRTALTSAKAPADQMVFVARDGHRPRPTPQRTHP